MTNEKWKDIKGYEGTHQVSNLGRIKSLQRQLYVVDKKSNREYYKPQNEKIMKQYPDNNGYPTICLLEKRMRVHRLVAKAFIDNPLNKKYVNHKDLNKSNNNISNLEWVTMKENNIHAIKNGAVNHKDNKYTRKKIHMCDLKSHEVIKTFASTTKAYEHFNRKYQGGISQVCNGTRNKAMGYWWQYAE